VPGGEKAAGRSEPGAVVEPGPAWLCLGDGKWKVDAGAAASVRRVFRVAIDGHGPSAIAKRVNAEGVSPIGNGDHWTRG
jgi:hypothetical protein